MLLRVLEILCLSIIACNPLERLYLPVPPVADSSRSLLLAITGSSGVRYFGYTLPRQADLDPPVFENEGLSLEAAVFGIDLQDLSLMPGEVFSTAASSLSLEGFIGLFSAEPDPSGTISWMSRTNLGDALSAFRLPIPDHPSCTSLSYEVVAVPTMERVLFAEPVRPGEVLAVDGDGAAFLATRSKVQSIEILPPESRITAADPTPEILWIAYRDAENRSFIGHGTFDGERLSLEAVTTGTTAVIRALARDPDRERFVALTTFHTLVTYSFLEGFISRGDLDGSTRRSSLAQGTDGRWLATLEDGLRVLELDGATVKSHFTDSMANIVTTDVDGNLLVGTELGRILRWTDGALTPVAQLKALGIRGLAGYRRGFAAGVEGGQVALYEDGEACVPEPVLGEFARPSIFQGFGTTVAVHTNSGDDRGFRPAPVVFLNLEDR